MSTEKTVQTVLSAPLPGPIYDPPYDSPIEDIFAENLVKYLSENVRLDRQVEVSTEFGDFVLDFVCTAADRSVAFECDGRDYHDAERDEWRDAFIMATRTVSSIWRISGKNIFWQLERSLYLVSRDEPSLFGERGRINLRILGEVDVVSVGRHEKASLLEFRRYPERLAHFLDDQDLKDRASCPDALRIRKTTDRRFSAGEPEWKRKVRFARHHRGKSIARIMELYPH